MAATAASTLIDSSGLDSADVLIAVMWSVQGCKADEAQSPVVYQLVREQVAELLQWDSLSAFCGTFCSRHAGTSLRHAVAAAQALVACDPGRAAEASQLVVSFRAGKGELSADCEPIHSISVLCLTMCADS